MLIKTKAIALQKIGLVRLPLDSSVFDISQDACDQKDVFWS